MKKILLLSALLYIVGLSAARACTCDPWSHNFRETIMRGSLGKWGHPDTFPYVVKAFMMEFSNDIKTGKMVVLEQYRGMLTLDTITYQAGDGASCFDNIFNGNLGDTIIALVIRLDEDINMQPPMYAGNFVNYYCEHNFIRIENDSVVNWDGNNGTSFPLSDLQDSVDYVYAHPVSVQDLDPHYTFEVFPNPAGDELKINATRIDIKEITILDLNGRVLISKSAKGNGTTVNVKGLSAGLYIASVRDKDEHVYRKKIMKR